MHGDGLTFRSVAWPDLTNGTFSLARLIVVGRRYRCPSCRATRRVAHLGLRTRCLYAVPAIIAVLHRIAPIPFGRAVSQEEAYRLATHATFSISERARSGPQRWASVNRWIRDLHLLWTSLGLPEDLRRRLNAFLVAFELGAPAQEVVDAAFLAHLREGTAM
jgi:hypothetical protein